MSDDLATRLAAMQDALKDAPLPASDDFPDQLDGIADGDYPAIINGFEVRDDYDNHPDVVSLKTLVQLKDSVHGGTDLEIFQWDILASRQLGYLKQHFYNLGIVDLDLTGVQNGSAMFEGLLDVPVLIGVYTGKSLNPKTGKPYRNIVVRRRLDDSDLGTGTEQIAGFENGTAPKLADCSCPDPANGVFDENCSLAGHGNLPF